MGWFEVDATRGGQAMSGSPWELILVLLLSATPFLSFWHFVAQLL
jgi:hypothetical protein